MNKIADVLTFFRLLAAPVLFVLILLGQWDWAMVLFIAAALSDAADGWFARRWPPASCWYRKDPHAFDNAADGALSVLAMAALVVRFFLAWRNSWPDGHLFVGWAVAAGVTLVATGVFLFLVGQLEPASAERVDVVHGVFYGALLLAVLVQITVLASGDMAVLWVSIYLISIGALILFKWDRLTSRSEVAYKGTKTWRTLFS